jgi:hypothetical protein
MYEYKFMNKITNVSRKDLVNMMNRRTFVKTAAALVGAIGGGSALSLALSQGTARAATTPYDSFLYVVRDTGIWRYMGTPLSGWEQIDTSTDIKQLESIGNTVIQLRPGGQVLNWSGKGASWETIANDPGIIQIAVSNLFDDRNGHPFVYQLNKDGYLSAWQTGQTWTTLCQVPGAVSIACMPNVVYFLTRSGAFYVYNFFDPNNPILSLVDHNPRAAIAATNENAFEFYNDGTVHYKGAIIAQNIHPISIASSEEFISTLDLLLADGTIIQYQVDSSGYPIVRRDMGPPDTDTIEVKSTEGDDLLKLDRKSGLWFCDISSQKSYQLDNHPNIKIVSCGATRVAQLSITSGPIL